jgi:hypothetical protein
LKEYFRFIGIPRIRLFLAFYISILLHILGIFYFFNSVPIWESPILCGPPWIYPPPPLEDEELELTFEVKSLLDENGDGEGKLSDSTQEGEEGEGNSYFDRDKYAEGEWAELVERLDQSKNIRKKFKNTFENIVKDGSVQDSYIHRKRDYEDIMVKEVFPTLYNIDKPFSEEIKQAPADLEVFQERNKIIDLYRDPSTEDDILQMRIEADGKKNTRSPLVMSKEDRMNYLDRNLTKKKEEQLKDFTSRFLNYDPDKGDLPLFLRDLYYENLQRLAYSFSSDPTYFTIDYFQENLNKEDFLKNSLALYSEFQDSKLGTEILFTLENIYDIQGRALTLYLQSQNDLSNLSEESKKELRVEVIRRVLERYKKLIQEKNIKSVADINRLYFKKRLEIMDTLIANTPDNYRLADGIFEKAKIHWEYSQTLTIEEKKMEQDKALDLWKKIQSSPSANGDFLNEKPLKEIKSILEISRLNPDGLLDMNAQLGISSILRNRLQEPLTAKKNREDKLLWKRSQTK